MLSDIKYVYCLFAYFALGTLFTATSLYLILWLTSFVDSGYFEDAAASKKFLSNLSLFSMIAASGFFPLFGFIADKVSAHILSPVSIAVRPIFVLMFIYLAELPDTWITFMAIMGMTLSTFLQSLVVHKLFLYELPKDVRGAMLGLFSLAG
jgi:hypothetical protein